MSSQPEALSSRLGLSPEQKETIAAEYLSELSPGRLPFSVFTQVARLMVTATVEMGLVKPPVSGNGSPQILLTQRDKDDLWWPSQWHVPGSMILASDEIADDHDYMPAVKRVLQEAGGSVELIAKPEFFDIVHRGDHRQNVDKAGDAIRGSEVTLHAVAEVRGEPDRGKFFDAADVILHPPDGGLIAGHDAVIQKMSAYYRRTRELCP